jgi:hypothetical protein
MTNDLSVDPTPPRPWRSGPLRRTVALADYAADSYVVRLYWGDDPKVLWVDFEIYLVAARQLAPGHLSVRSGVVEGLPAYHDDKLHFVTDIDAARPDVTGFVKWDGCTQFRLAPGSGLAHVDSRAGLHAFCDAIDKARELAAQVMTPDADVRHDYGSQASLRPLDGVGDHLAWDAFAARCRAGTYADVDGFAELATAEEVSEISIAPSRVDIDFRPPWVTHVVWYGGPGTP